MEVKLQVVVKVDFKEALWWHKLLVGARAFEEKDHGRSGVYKELDEADRIVCGIAESYTIAFSPRAACVIRDYCTETINWTDANPMPATNENWMWCQVLAGAEDALDHAVDPLPAEYFKDPMDPRD